MSSDDRIIIQGDPDLEDLIPGFLSNRAEDINRIRTALNASDLEKIRIIGHSMKGAGGGYGFDAITDIGSEIEQAAIASDTAAIEKQIAILEDYLQRVDVVYEE